MSRIIYPANSPYYLTPQSSWSIGNLVFRPIPADHNDTLYTLRMHHQYRPDRLSYELYTTPAYWWVFSVRNAFLRRDPIWEFIAGLTIIVPSADYVHRILGG